MLEERQKPINLNMGPCARQVTLMVMCEVRSKLLWLF
jgi:hypothetical protein